MRAIDDLARRQHGVFSLSQAAAAGCTDGYRRWRLETGAWAATRFPSVYRLPSHAETWHQGLWAAWLWAPPDSLIAGRSAAALYGLDRCPPGRIELLLPLHAKHTAPRGVKVHRSRYLGVPRMIDRLPVCDPETTLLGVARAVRADTLEDVLESAFDKDLTSPEKLLLAIGRRHGSGAIRRVLGVRFPGPARQSRLEGEFERLVRLAGHRVERQVEVLVRRRRFVLDFVLPALGVAVELDGFGKLRTKSGKQQFLERATLLQLGGYRLVHFGWDDVMGRPSYVLGCLAETKVG